jgi:hypothetical protein
MERSTTMTAAQSKVLKRIANGDRPTCLEWRTTRALMEKGLIERQASFPFAKVLTDTGRKAVQ